MPGVKWPPPLDPPLPGDPVMPTSDQSPEPRRASRLAQGEMHWIEATKRVASCLITTCMTALVFYGIIGGFAVLRGHWAVLVVLLVSVLVLLAYLEGLQVALLNAEKADLSPFISTHPRAVAVQALLHSRSRGMEKFFMGRQFFVVCVVYISAQVTTFPDMPNFLGFPDWLFFLVVKTGLPGALVVLMFAQLMPQLVATTHPVSFMNLPGAIYVLHITLLIEQSGLTHCSWVVEAAVKRLLGLGKQAQLAEPPSAFGVEYDPSSPQAGSNQEASWKQDDTEFVLPRHAFDDQELRQWANEGLSESAEEEANRGVEQAQHLEEWRFSPQADKYPGPQDFVAHLLASKQPLPRFLLPPTHPQHIPPHIVAYELMKRTEELREQLKASCCRPPSRPPSPTSLSAPATVSSSASISPSNSPALGPSSPCTTANSPMAAADLQEAGPAAVALTIHHDE